MTENETTEPTAEEIEAAEAAADEAAEEAPSIGRTLPADFATFVLSLNAAALLHMGDAHLPEGEVTPPKNFPLAKQSIDLLAMLEEKTKGNLDGEEEKLLGQVLYDLRMRFVRHAS